MVFTCYVELVTIARHLTLKWMCLNIGIPGEGQFQWQHDWRYQVFNQNQIYIAATICTSSHRHGKSMVSKGIQLQLRETLVHVNHDHPLDMRACDLRSPCIPVALDRPAGSQKPKGACTPQYFQL